MRRPLLQLPIILGAVLTGPTACAHRAMDTPEEQASIPLAALFADHPVWISVASRTNPPGSFPPGEVSLVRRWELVENQADGTSSLVEVDASSLSDIVARANRNDLKPRVVSINNKMFMDDFFASGEPLPPSQFATLVRTDAKRFELVMDEGAARVSFVPAPNDYAPDAGQNPEPNKEIGIWTTPFGPESEIFGYLRQRLGPDAALPTSDGRFLHHNLRGDRRIAVRVDPSFPRRYRVAVAQATQIWSAAFPSALFDAPVSTTTALDPGDCLTGFTLCFQWRGRDEIPATGASAYTQLSFDPHSGLILGGIVTVVNEGERKLTPMADNLATKFAAGSLNWDEMADVVSRGVAFDGYVHPEPTGLVEAMLIHEIGHFNGFAHNFLVRPDTTPSMPSHTVMAYPPFPVTHLMTMLGEQDHARIALVYGADKRTDRLAYCSAFEAMNPERARSGIFRKKAACDIYTLGDAADWYLRLARRAGGTVFADYPDLSNLPPAMVAVYHKQNKQKQMPPLNILTRLGFILTDRAAPPTADATKVHAALCGMSGERRQIVAQLRAYHGYELTCPAE